MNMKKIFNLSFTLILISVMVLVSCKKKDGPEPTSKDYATAIAGTYLGDITLSISSDSDTIQDVSIILTKVNDSTVSFYVNQTLTISSYGLDVPLIINQQTKVTKSDENYNFSLTESVTVPDIPFPIPVTVTGVVTGSNMNLTIDVNVVVFTITAYYQGTKQ